MARASTLNFDVTSFLDQATGQFRGLNPSEPGQWPSLPKAAAWLAAAVVVVVVGWFALLSTAHDELEAARLQEPTLKETYRNRLTQAVNLNELRKQKLQVQEYVTQLEKQLPGKAEMDALLSDINQAGLGRGLQFELFRPGQVQVKDYYAELPIAIRVSGRYPRRGLIRRRCGQPVAHRHAAEPDDHTAAAQHEQPQQPVGDGSHRTHLPLPGQH